MAGWCTRRGTPGGRRWGCWRACWTAGPASPASWASAPSPTTPWCPRSREIFESNPSRSCRLMGQRSFAHHAMVRALLCEMSESVPRIRVVVARLARLVGHRQSLAHCAMARAREREVYVHSRAISESVPHIRVFMRALSREISESVPHIRVVLARLARLTGRPSFTHHAMARARERSEILDARARERGTEIPESGTSGPHTRSDVDSPSYPSHSCPSHSYPSRTHGPF